MINNQRRLSLLAFLCASLLYLALGCGRAAVFVAATNEYSVYAFDLLAAFGAALLTIFGCALYLIRRADMRPIGALVGVLPMAAARVLYILPYDLFYYLIYGYDALDALLIGAIQSVLEILLTVALTVALGEVARRVLGEERVLDVESAFDFSRKSTAALFIPTFAFFLYRTLTEIYSAIRYLITYYGTYRTEEIVYMVISFVMLLVMLLLWQALTVLVVRLLRKFKFYTEVSL